MSGPLQPYLSPSSFSTKTTGATVVPYAVRLPRNPTTADRDYPVGSIWANLVSYEAFILTAIVAGAAQWAPCGLSPLGDVRQLEGDSGGPVGPTANKIDIVGAAGSGITVVGNPGTSTLTITSGSSWYEATVTTTDATPTTLLTIPVPAATSLVFDGRLVGYATSGSGAASAVIKASAYRFGANNALLIGDGDQTLDKIGVIPPGNSSAKYENTVSGTDTLVVVTGIVGVTINWKIQGLATTVGI